MVSPKCQSSEALRLTSSSAIIESHCAGGNIYVVRHLGNAPEADEEDPRYPSLEIQVESD